ncbi:hypothetical protein [Sanguibacter sp. Z1732]|uniref:hypothetical protein n=1 Tax=Sanguibacter sp. Z1732 TaxID=3435412 RepID=UPI003D9C8C3A
MRKDWVSSGNPDQLSAGEMFPPASVKDSARGVPSVMSGLVRVKDPVAGSRS